MASKGAGHAPKGGQCSKGSVKSIPHGAGIHQNLAPTKKGK